MPRENTEPQMLTVGQLAKRWGVGADRIRKLIDAGFLPGTFRIPAAGRYGETTKIPLRIITDVEQQWLVAQPKVRTVRPRSHRNGTILDHFPELWADESASECPAGDPC